MPGKIKVKVLAGRNLPVMDRASDTTDAFVEIKFGNVTHKTDVCRKSLNPHWSSTEWYRFEVDESELQDEPLQLRLMDHDTYSANDAIGKVVISLAPLLAREADTVKGIGGPPGGAVLSGWIPVFDTMHGIRGELNVIVKVELFSDFNKYKTSSCGVQFFHCPMIPPGYKATAVHGFVEELVVNDDPEYQWIDKIRTPRASNEARQVAFIKLSNQVQRLVGLKAAELGANAVVGYQQDFDLEGEAGVVARAIGTAVSIIPPPNPNQSISIPSCTQQQLKKYLDILATDSESITDLNQYYQSHQDELQKLLSIMNPKTPPSLDDPDNNEDDDQGVLSTLTRQSSVNSYTGGLSIYQDDFVSQQSLKHISEDQTDLNKLLKRNDDSDSDSSGPLQKMKLIKSNFFSRRFGSMRSRKTDKQDDQISLQSNSSDNSRISLTDIKNEFKKFKRLKKPKFRKTFANKQDEGIGMASILARSVIHAHTSLACIAETQDSEPSPSSTMRRTSESEPTINMSDDDKPKTVAMDTVGDNKPEIETKIKVPEIHMSLRNVSTEGGDVGDTVTPQRITSESCPATPMTQRSENLLKLPGELGYFGSLSLSGDSSEVYSSSEEDDESSDQKTDTEKSVETTSSVVQSVLKNGVNQALIAQVDRKLRVLKTVGPELKESKSQVLLEREEKCNKSKSSPCIHGNDININEILESKNELVDTTVLNNAANAVELVKPISNHHFKFSNPFGHKKVSESISAPSSPVEDKGFMYRSSKRIKHQISKITNSNMMKSLSHYSLRPKKKHPTVKVALSQPGSTSDVPSKAPSHETVLGSPFLSYADLFNLHKEEPLVHDQPPRNSQDFEQSKVTMYIGSEPVSRASLSGPSFPHSKEDSHHQEQKPLRRETLKPTCLVHTAMETILMDKVQSLLVATSPECTHSKEQQFFYDVNVKLEKFEEARSQFKQCQVHQDHIPRNVSISRKSSKNDSLFNTAMETILMDKVQSLLTPTTPDAYQVKDNKFFAYFNENSGNFSKAEYLPEDRQHTTHEKEHCRFKDNKKKHDSLVQTAMKTILIDKVQALMPSADNFDFDDSQSSEDEKETLLQHTEVEKSHKPDNDHQGGLLHTAMETMLMDKIQTLISPKSEKNPLEIEKFGETYQEKHLVKEKTHKDQGIFHTAMETMLLEKAQSIIPTASESIHQENDIPPYIQRFEKSQFIDSHGGLLHTATETIRQDEAQATKPAILENISPKNKIPSDAIHETIPSETINEIEKQDRISKDSKDSGLLHSAMEMILMDKVNSLIPTDSEPKTHEDQININTHQTLKNIKNNEKSNENKSGGLFHSAMETILFDKVQSLLSPVSGEVIDSDQKDKDNSELKGEDSVIFDKKNKKLVRQISVHSLQESEGESQKMSKEIVASITVPSKITHSKPVLQHFHPILSGPPLDTIPSLPESSLDHTESIDVEGVERTCDCQAECQWQGCNSETNSASVCDNSHAACRFDRNDRDKEKYEKDKGSPRHARHESYGGREPVVSSMSAMSAQNSSLNSSSAPLGIHRRSSDSDLSVTPKGSSLNASVGNVGSGGAILRPSMNSNNLEMLEYPFLTMSEYPPGFIINIGGTVCARSVKLVDAGGESAARAAWWAELRTELRAHARALRCNAVIAYSESAAICEDVCVLSASGTAVVINLDCDFNYNQSGTPSSPVSNGGSVAAAEESETEYCTVAHVPYSPGTGPYKVDLSTCGGCRRARVPAVLLATCAKPSKLQSYAKAVTVTAVAARVRRAPPASEPGARDISDQLPFLEYELHKLLLAKLRMQGANALFSLQTQIAIGERCVMALANGTAVRLAALPPPTPPRVKSSENDKDAFEIQRALWESFAANKTSNGYDIAGNGDAVSNTALPEIESEEPIAPALDLCADKDTCILELDEAEDVETAKALAVRRSQMQVYSSSLKAIPGAAPQAFAQVWRARLVLTAQGGGASTAAERHVARALDGITYKLRRLQPCALVAPRFQIELPEDEIQLVVSGSAIPLVDPNKSELSNPDTSYSQSSQSPQPSQGNGSVTGSGNGDMDDDIFALDEEQLTATKSSPPTELTDDKNIILNGYIPTTVSLTSLSHVSGSRATRRICALRLLFVRETTAVRELGGLSGFLHTFTCEVLAIVRAYTAALGGNMLTSFYLKQLMLQDNAHKNQGQCLLSVGGDVVQITY